MRLHREGRTIILIAIALFFLINGATNYWFSVYPILTRSIFLATVVLLVLVLQFFRVPRRTRIMREGLVICPADGKVVAIEEVFEDEFLKEKRIQVSIFMSPLNVHINWYPISGKVIYEKYHPGKFLVAWHPKSSTDNERTTVVLENDKGSKLLLRQIAGAVARRIVLYSKTGQEVEQCGEMGFIKFGSRVDVLLPLDSNLKVKIGQKVTGTQTVLAELAF